MVRPDSDMQAVTPSLQKDHLSAMCESFLAMWQPFERRRPTISAISQDEAHHFAIFRTREIEFCDSQQQFRDVPSLLRADQRGFLASNVTTVAHDQYFIQITRPMEGSVSDPHAREANQFEVFLCIFDQKTESFRWVMHTTTAGGIRPSLDAIPEAVWSHHPTLPLLFWTLPGHAFRVSYLHSSCSPINVAGKLFCLYISLIALTFSTDSFTFETQAAEAIKFSPNGRYISIRALPVFKNDFLDGMVPLHSRVTYVTVLDLVLGTCTTLSLTGARTLSFELNNEHLSIYQLTRLGAIQVDRFFLPDLDTFDRHIISFIPSDCCCATCCKPLGDKCYISITERQGVKLIGLGHSPFCVDKSSATDNLCEPILFSIASPEIPVKVYGTNDSMVQSRKMANFPPLLTDAGELLLNAFSLQGTTTLRESLNARNKAMEDSEKPSSIPQMQIRASDWTDRSGRKLDVGGLETAWYEDYHEAVCDLAFEDELHQSLRNDEVLEELNADYGDMFPSTWDEFQAIHEALDEENDPTWHKWMKTLFENHGIGCNLPLYVHTFYYNSSEAAPATLTWSSAVDIGWIEEATRWFYSRFIKNDFRNSRMWYHFHQYSDVPAVHWSGKTRALRNARRKLKKLERAAVNHPGSIELVIPTKSKGEPQPAMDDEDEEMAERMMQLRDFMEDLEDNAPGLGRLFRDRMSQFLNQSLIGDED